MRPTVETPETCRQVPESRRGAVERGLPEIQSIAGLLALGGNIGTKLGMSGEIEKGLPSRSVDGMVKLFEKRNIVGPVVPEGSYRRALKSRKRLSAQTSARLYNVARTYHAATRILGDEERAISFMMAPNPFLQGHKPFDVARRNSVGADAVIELLQQVQAGIPA